jgi:hypothetical protein
MAVRMPIYLLLILTCFNLLNFFKRALWRGEGLISSFLIVVNTCNYKVFLKKLKL